MLHKYFSSLIRTNTMLVLISYEKSLRNSSKNKKNVDKITCEFCVGMQSVISASLTEIVGVFLPILRAF